MPFSEGRTPREGFLPGTSPTTSKRTEKRAPQRAADRGEEEESKVGRERFDLNIRGRAQNQLLSNPVASEKARPNNPRPITTISSSAYTQRRPSGAQSPPRGPHVYDKAYSIRTNVIHTPAAYDRYVPEPDHEAPRSAEPSWERSPLLKPVHYEAYLQRQTRPQENSIGDRENWDELGSPGSPRGPFRRGRLRSRSRSPHSPAPASATSTNSSRRTNSGRYKSEQERAASTERRASEAAEYLRARQSLQIHPSRKLLASQGARSSDPPGKPLSRGISNSQADRPERPITLQSSEIPRGFDVPSESPQSPKFPTATIGVHMASEVPARLGRENDAAEDQALLFYNELSNMASLKARKAEAEASLGKSLSEYDKAKDKIFTRFPSTSEASAKIKDTSAGIVKNLEAEIAVKDAVLKDIGLKVPALLHGGGETASAFERRIEELENKCEEYKGQCEGYKAQLQKQQNDFMAELHKTLKRSFDEYSTSQKQNNDKFASVQSEIDTLKAAHITLKSTQEASHAKVVRLEQDVPPNLKQSLQKLGPLSVRMDATDNARRELRMSYEESTNKNREILHAHSSSIRTIQEKVDKLTLEREEIDHQLKTLKNLDLASTTSTSQTAISSLDERLKKSEKQITKYMSSLAQFQSLEKKTSAIDAKVEQRITDIEQRYRDVRESAVRDTRDRDYPSGLIETRLSALETQSRVDSFKDEKDSFRKDIMHDVEQLQNGTIELMGGLIEGLQTETSNTKERVNILEAFSTSAKSDISQADGRISSLEDSRHSASNDLSETKERIVILENKPESSATGVDALQRSIDTVQANIQQLQQDLKDAKTSIPGIATTQVLETIRAQPHLLPYAFNTPLLIDVPRRLDETVTALDHVSARIRELSTRIDDVDFKNDQLDQRMSNINTKEQAHFIVSQIAEQYPSLRNAIDTVVLKLDVEALSKRISATEEAQGKTSFLDGGSLAYAPLRKDVDELSKKLNELKNTTQELKKVTQDVKKDFDLSHSDIAGEFARIQVEVEAVAGVNTELKEVIDSKFRGLKYNHHDSVANIEHVLDDIGTRQETLEEEIRIIKDSQTRAEKEFESIKVGQKKSDQEIEFIKGQKRSEIQASRNSIASPFDNKDFTPRSAPKSSLFQTNATRQNSVLSDANGKKRSKNGSSSYNASTKGDPTTNGGPSSRKKRKLTGGDTSTVEISDSD